MRYAWTLLFLVGCTSGSTKLAIESGNRVEEIQDTIFKGQQNAILTFMQQHEYKDQAVLFKDVEALLLWTEQWERARALRMLTVDTKVYSTQAMSDLIWKQFNGRLSQATD